MQRAETFFTPLRQPKPDPASHDQLHSDCVYLISQTLEHVAKSSGVLAMTPRQSSDSSTALINHVEVLCQVIPLLQDNIRISASKLKDIEQQNQDLSRKLASLHEEQNLQSNKQSSLEMQSQNQLMAATIVTSKMHIQELAETCRHNVRINVCCSFAL
jgi:hypothetical protein